jgi:hypothetical protein
MKTLDEVVEATRELPEELQSEVRDFARFLRESRGPPAQPGFAEQLAAMARDPQIQSQIRRIEREFVVAEGDGLRPE